MKKRGKRAPLGLGRWIVILICAIVFCGSLGYLGLYVKDMEGAQQEFTKMKEKEDFGLEKMYAENQDFVGWLTVKDTRIDYPVMLTPNDPEFYLHRNFKKEYSESGTPFIDEHSVLSGENKTWNWLIYGHHMKFGTMFHDLIKYEDKDFWDGHKTFTFDVYRPEYEGDKNITDGSEYEVFAACYSKIRSKTSTEFKYYQYPGFTDEKTFDEYVAGVKSEAVYNTGITPTYGDQLVTLSTCAYQTKEGRFYIVGRRID